MRWSAPSRFAVLALVLCLSAPAGPAEPQGGPTSAANAANLRVAAQLGRQALTSLEAPDAKARLPQTLSLLRQMLDRVKSAQTGMDALKNVQRLPDPALDLYMRRLETTQGQIRHGIDRAAEAVPWDQYLEETIPRLREAVRTVEMILAMGP
jgi:hypothetical protein